MAKKKIENYVFRPGLGIDDNAYPNAWSLINQNYNFIKKEVAAWIQTQIDNNNPDFLFNRAKCIRDLGYITDAVQYDMIFGTNYNAVFQGTMEQYSIDISNTVVNTLVNAKARFADLSGVKASATAVARHNAGWDEVIDVAQNGYLSADTVTWANPTNANTDNINAKDQLDGNLNFIVNDASAYVNINYPTLGYNQDLFENDIKIIVMAATYDIL